VLFELDRPRPAALERVAQPVQRADAGVACPREDQLPGAAHADELVVDHVRRHPHERQVALALTDHLVPGRERDQVGEPFHRHDVPVPHVRGDGVAQARRLHRR
jgi:hypothetical protein